VHDAWPSRESGLVVCGSSRSLAAYWEFVVLHIIYICCMMVYGRKRVFVWVMGGLRALLLSFLCFFDTIFTPDDWEAKGERDGVDRWMGEWEGNGLL
jgi:hypothetical protein